MRKEYCGDLQIWNNFNDNVEGHYFPGEHVHLLTKTKEAHVGLDIDFWIG